MLLMGRELRDLVVCPRFGCSVVDLRHPKFLYPLVRVLTSLGAIARSACQIRWVDLGLGAIARSVVQAELGCLLHSDGLIFFLTQPGGGPCSR